MFKCEYCGQEYEKYTSMAGHKAHCKMNPKYEENRRIFSENGKNTSKKMKDVYKERIHPYKLTCEYCGKEFVVEMSEKEYNDKKEPYRRYCCKACANKGRKINRLTKEQLENTIKIPLSIRRFKNPIKNIKLCVDKSILEDVIDEYKEDKKRLNILHICPICHKVYYKNPYDIQNPKNMRFVRFCSKECHQIFWETIDKTIFRQAGLKSSSIQSEIRRSKNEILFYEKCLEIYPDAVHNVPLFNGWDADVIIPSLKVAISWNGAWHYKNISKKNSLKQIQNRDEIKDKEIKKVGYVHYIIKDMGKYDDGFVDMEFIKFQKWINTLKLQFFVH